MKSSKIIRNPFFEIMHKGDEKIRISPKETARIKKLSDDLTKNHSIVLIVGEPGAGKSLVEKSIRKNIPRNFEKLNLVFSLDLANELKSILFDRITKKKRIVFIDKFELSETVNNKKLREIINLIISTSKNGVGLVVSSLPESIMRAFSLSEELKKISKIYNVPKLSYNQAKALVISRLNLIRKKKSDSLHPFTESQIKNVWMSSKGNPRMILLLCANLYDIIS